MLIGAQKAGTSSLYNWISQHPEIYAPEEMKDFHFFTMEKLFKQGTDYLKQYYRGVKSEKVVLKGAVNYIFLPQTAQKLFNYNPDLTLILILRNPFHRAISAYNYFHNLGIENLSFEDALDRELSGELKTIKEKSNFAYLEHGYYFKQLQPYLKYFSSNKIKILIYENLIRDKEKEIKDLFKFLEVSIDFVPDFNYVNRTGKVRFRKLNHLLFGDSIFKWLINPITKRMPITWKIKFGNIIREKNKRAIDPTRDSVKFPLELKNIYDTDIDKLSEFLNQDLRKKWKID